MIRLAPTALLGLLLAVPASAQTNLSGVWNNFGIFHEDEPDRLPGAELGDYTGIPVTEAVRLGGDSWDAPSFAPIRI